MLLKACPKLPMRNANATKEYYVSQLGFSLIAEYPAYLILKKEEIELHFFEHTTLQPEHNYGQVYLRVSGIETEYKTLIENGVAIHPNGHLATKPWGQKEFALLDPDNNLLTFGEGE